MPEPKLISVWKEEEKWAIILDYYVHENVHVNSSPSSSHRVSIMCTTREGKQLTFLFPLTQPYPEARTSVAFGPCQLEAYFFFFFLLIIILLCT